MSLADYIKTQIDATRDVIGRDIDVYTKHLSACPLCTASGYYDPVGDISFYTVCPVCSGTFWLNVPTKTPVLARVHWVGNEAITATPGGKYFMGDAQATIDPSYHSLFVSAQNEGGKVVIDGQEMDIVQIRPMGVATINRYRIILKGTGNRPSI